jgi:hypothetical protein
VFLTFLPIEKGFVSVQATLRERHLRMKTMASEPKQPDDQDNIVSLREARARQAAQAKKLNASKTAGVRFGGAGATPQRKIPAAVIFLGLLAALVGYRYLTGGFSF